MYILKSAMSILTYMDHMTKSVLYIITLEYTYCRVFSCHCRREYFNGSVTTYDTLGGLSMLGGYDRLGGLHMLGGYDRLVGLGMLN